MGNENTLLEPIFAARRSARDSSYDNLRRPARVLLVAAKHPDAMWDVVREAGRRP